MRCMTHVLERSHKNGVDFSTPEIISAFHSRYWLQPTELSAFLRSANAFGMLRLDMVLLSPSAVYYCLSDTPDIYGERMKILQSETMLRSLSQFPISQYFTYNPPFQYGPGKESDERKRTIDVSCGLAGHLERRSCHTFPSSKEIIF
jgi:hypothetical protein